MLGVGGLGVEGLGSLGSLGNTGVGVLSVLPFAALQRRAGLRISNVIVRIGLATVCVCCYYYSVCIIIVRYIGLP